MRKNWFTTVGGIMSGFLLVPEALGSAKVAMPGWLYMICIFVGTLGPVVIGIGAKGQDESSRPPANITNPSQGESTGPSLSVPSAPNPKP